MIRNFFATILFVLFAMGAVRVQAQLPPADQQRLVDTARWLGSLHISYADEWIPPGGTKPIVMDCSNTARYIYHYALAKKLPRTASDQFYTLRQKNRVWAAPRGLDGLVDTPELMKHLRSGDLLFWEWTYDIKRTPPITHVMVYLGKTPDGKPMMFGSSQRPVGEQTRRGGVDVYEFNPNASMGGVKGFFGQYIHKGRFVGFGRPE